MGGNITAALTNNAPRSPRKRSRAFQDKYAQVDLRFTYINERELDKNFASLKEELKERYGVFVDKVQGAHGFYLKVRGLFPTRDKELDEHYANEADSLGFKLYYVRSGAGSFYRIEEKDQSLSPISAPLHLEKLRLLIEDLKNNGKIIINETGHSGERRFEDGKGEDSGTGSACLSQGVSGDRAEGEGEGRKVA